MGRYSRTDCKTHWFLDWASLEATAKSRYKESGFSTTPGWVFTPTRAVQHMVKQRATSNVGKVPWDCNLATLCFTDFKPKRADKFVPTPANPGFRSTWMTWN